MNSDAWYLAPVEHVWPPGAGLKITAIVEASSAVNGRAPFTAWEM